MTSVPRRTWWGVGAATITLAIAGVAALVMAPDGHFAFGVESVSSATTGLVQRPSANFPAIYALFAGMLAAFNPCGFALLPGYLGLYLRGGAGQQTVAGTVLRPVRIASAVAAAFIAVFGLVGFALGAAGAALSSLFPWIGLAVGVLLIITGGAILGGRTFLGFGQGLADELGGVASRGGIRGYFAYGIAYALASLGCALPIFLSVVGSALLVRGWIGQLLQFVLYALGMAVVLAVLTMAAAIFKAQLLQRLGDATRLFEPLSAVLLLLVGAYVVYYWLTVGGVIVGRG